MKYIFSCLFLILISINSNFSQTMEETLKYINDKHHEVTGYSISDDGSIIYKNTTYPKNVTYWEDNTYTFSPFDVFIENKDNNFNLKCFNKEKKQSVNGDNCIKHKRKKSNEGGATPHSVTYLNNYFDGSSHEKKALEKAYFHLINLAKIEYTKYLVNLSKSDPFMDEILISSSNNRIKMRIQNDVYYVPVEINNVLKIEFILDTGASELFLSPEIAATLLRTNTLSEQDFIGNTVYRFANGKTESCRRYKLKSVRIGNITIKDVSCAIANNIIGDMLLGQSFLSKLGNFEINYSTNEIIIK